MYFAKFEGLKFFEEIQHEIQHEARSLEKSEEILKRNSAKKQPRLLHPGAHFPVLHIAR